MKKFENYLLLDSNSNDIIQINRGTVSREHYSIKVAMILEEELVFKNKSTCAIIHCIATAFEYDDTHHLKSLLYEAFHQQHMRDKTVVFVYNYGDNPFKMFANDDEDNDPRDATSYEKIFLDMGFKKADLLSIKDDIPNKSLTMIGDSNQIVSYCKRYRVFSTNHQNDTHRICMLNGAKKIKYRYNNESKLEVFSHAFLWEDGIEQDLDRITTVKREIAKQNVGTEYPFTGGGFREHNHDKSNVTFDKSNPIPTRYQQCTNGKSIHNCVWLNTALIIRLMNEDDGNRMIDMFERRSRSYKEYDWLNVKPPKGEKARNLATESGDETLTTKMVRDVGYFVNKVPKTRKDASYLSQLLDHNTSGKYIARLRFSNKQNHHYVGIDCDTKLIWDSIEEYAMHLTVENLNYCSGKPGITIEVIEAVYTFQNNNKKRKSKDTSHVAKKQNKNK